MRPLSLTFRLLVGCALACSTMLPAQGAPGDDQEVSIPGGKAIHGVVLPGGTAAHLSLKDDEGTGTFQVVVTPNTRVVRDRNPVRPADIKPGESVLAFGTYDDASRSLHALFLSVIDPAELKRAKENLGKTYITGTVLSIADLKLVIRRPDGVRQTIAVDESTSFRRGGRRAGSPAGVSAEPGGNAAASPSDGESLTLADIKPGGYVMGAGALKQGIFVPTVLRVLDSGPGGSGAHRSAANAGHPAAAPQ